MKSGRPRTFDESTALQQAMQHFWLYGYAATSISDLIQTMGISKASLYQTFGNKKALFLLALQRYQTELCRRLTDELERSESGFAFIRNLLDDVRHEATQPGARHGCLLVNLANEIGRNDEELTVPLKQALRSVEPIFVRAIDSAKQAGDIPAHVESQSMATFLMTSISGIRTMIRAGAREDEISPVIDTLLLSIQSAQQSSPDLQIK